MSVRDLVYKIKQEASQPQFWLDMGNKGDVAGCKAKLSNPVKEGFKPPLRA
jgi:hypothetical protein